MLHALPGDLLYLCTDLVTGKSIPLLLGITLLPLDHWLTAMVLILGALSGTLYSAWVARNVCNLSSPIVAFGNMAVQTVFAIFSSISLAFQISTAITPTGIVLSCIPAFCVIAQPYPQRHSTALLALALNACFFYVSMITGIMRSLDFEAVSHLNLLHTRTLMGVDEPVSRMGLMHARTLMSLGMIDQLADTVWRVVTRSVLIFVLAFYASVQHAPLQAYIGKHLEKPLMDPVYASRFIASNPLYCSFASLCAAWIRCFVWLGVTFFHNNALHLIIENQRRREWPWVCCYLYMTALLFSAGWSWTQLTEQVLPCFFMNLPEKWEYWKPPGGTFTQRMKLPVLTVIVAFSAYYHQSDPWILIVLALVLSVVTITSALVSLGQDAGL